MRKLRQLSVRSGNLHVPKAHRLGQCVDVGLRPGHEMPARRRIRASVPLQVGALLGRGQVRALARIDAHHNHIEVLAGYEAHHLQGPCQPVQFLRAQHGALVVNQRQNRRTLAEVAAQLHLLPMVVGKGERKRQLPIQILRNPHAVQNRRRLVVRRAHLLVAVTGDLRHQTRDRRRRAKPRRHGHRHRRASPTSPHSACPLHLSRFPSPSAAVPSRPAGLKLFCNF